MVTTGFARDVDVLSHLNITPSTKNDRAAIPPSTQSIRRQPIHPEIGGRAVFGNQRSVTEVFKLRVAFVSVVGYSCRSDAGVGGSRVEKELFDLMAADVTQYSAILRLFEKPSRPCFGAQAMRP